MVEILTLLKRKLILLLFIFAIHSSHIERRMRVGLIVIWYRRIFFECLMVICMMLCYIWDILSLQYWIFILFLYEKTKLEFSLPSETCQVNCLVNNSLWYFFPIKNKINLKQLLTSTSLRKFSRNLIYFPLRGVSAVRDYCSRKAWVHINWRDFARATRVQLLPKNSLRVEVS
jgi:hypothetical protein